MIRRVLTFACALFLGCGGSGTSSGPGEPQPTPSADVGTPGPTAAPSPSPTAVALPAGSLDPTFGESGIVLVDVPPGTATVVDFAIDERDGLAVLVRTLDPDREVRRQVGVLRLNADGSPTVGFGDGGFVEMAIAPRLAPCAGRPCDDLPSSILLLPDDRVLLSVGVESQALEPYHSGSVLVLYRPDGALDPGFGDAGLRTPSAGDLQFDSEHRIVGMAGTPDTTASDFAVLRLLADLEPDTTFGADGIASAAGPTDNTYSLYRAAPRPDGGIVVGGRVGLVPAGRPVISAFTSNGSLDTSFGRDGFVTEFPADLRFASAEELLVDHAGRIVATLYDRLARYTPSGRLDPDFGEDGSVPIGFSANALLGSPEDHVLIAGNQSPPSIAGVVARWDANGNPDESFGDGGSSTLATVDGHPASFVSAVLDSRERIVVLGQISGQPETRLFLARYLTRDTGAVMH